MLTSLEKHQRPTNELPQGGIIEKEAAIHVSNVQVWTKMGVAGRGWFTNFVDGKKVRYNKNPGEVLD